MTGDPDHPLALTRNNALVRLERPGAVCQHHPLALTRNNALVRLERPGAVASTIRTPG